MSYQTINITKGNFKAELLWEGDGYVGKFQTSENEEDDAPLLRLRLYKKAGGWQCIHEFVSWLRMTDNPVILSRCLVLLIDRVAANEEKITNISFLDSLKELHIGNGRPKIFLPKD